nr:hypothetical protein [Gemmatimonadota bacterium]
MTTDPPSARVNITVTPPVRRQDIAEGAPAGKMYFPQGVASPPSDPGADQGVSRSRRVAVLICHGMGQQVPFEHIDAISQAIVRGAPKGTPREIRVGYATLGEARLPRAEIDLQVDGERREVHVYEAYWAPLTEGKVSATAVTRFLFDAGLRGLHYMVHGSFTRWMLGGWQEFRLGAGTLVPLLGALAVVCAGLLLYGALGVTVALRTRDLLFGAVFLSEAAHAFQERILHGLVRSPLLLGLAFLPGIVALWIYRLLRAGRWLIRSVGGALLLGAVGWAVMGGYGAGVMIAAIALAAAVGTGLLIARRLWAVRVVSSLAALAVAAWTVLA